MKIKVCQSSEAVSINGKEYPVRAGHVEVPDSEASRLIKRFPDRFCPPEPEPKQKVGSVLSEIKEV